MGFREIFLDRTIEILCLRLFLWSATNPYWCRILAAYLSLRKNVSFTFHSSVFLDDNLRCFSWRRWNCCRHRRLFGRFTSFSSSAYSHFFFDGRRYVRPNCWYDRLCSGVSWCILVPYYRLCRRVRGREIDVSDCSCNHCDRSCVDGSFCPGGEFSIRSTTGYTGIIHRFACKEKTCHGVHVVGNNGFNEFEVFFWDRSVVGYFTVEAW